MLALRRWLRRQARRPMQRPALPDRRVQVTSDARSRTTAHRRRRRTTRPRPAMGQRRRPGAAQHLDRRLGRPRPRLRRDEHPRPALTLRDLRQRVGKANLSEVGEDRWRETMDDNTVKTTRSIGWLMFIAGLLAIAGIGVVGFLFSDEIPVGMKLIIIAVYGGLATLLYSVLRQRLIERKTDKYKDVEI